MTRPYYSIRTGKNPLGSQIDLPTFLILFGDLYKTFSEKGYFQEGFGYSCVDAGQVAGKLGGDVEAQMLRKIRKSNLWPIQDKCTSYSDDDVFDVIEFIYDYVSKPIAKEGNYHNYNNCGWHYETFNREIGRQEYRNEINELLRDFLDGYELSIEGEILALPEKGLDSLFHETLPMYDPKNVNTRVDKAILKFRRYRSVPEDRRDAIRDLADVLEFLRKKIEKVISRKDESDLFIIANQFGIRHHDDTQKDDYDKSIWYSWMFSYYLATIHATVRLIEKYEQDNSRASLEK